MIFVLFYLENRRDNLHEVSNPIFYVKCEKYFKCHLLLPNMQSVNTSEP